MLKDIKHISFDAWNTLLDPSKEFATRRAWSIVRVVEAGHLDTVNQKYSGVKKVLDTLAELKGISFDVDTNWRLLASQFKHGIDDDALVELRKEVEQKFLETPPNIPEALIEALHLLKSKGYTMNVLSNTNFIGGHVLEQLFAQTFGEGFFDFTLYSDQDGMAKPNPTWYGKVVGIANAFHQDLHVGQILHIGDNEITDYEGARAIGLSALKVKSPYHLATVLLESL